MTMNIQIFVDVVALLSGAPQSQAVHLFDDGCMGSEGLGGPTLVSHVLPGQLLRWTVNPVDVQSQVWIKSIAFGPAPASHELENVATEDAQDALAVHKSPETQAWVCDPAPDALPWGKRFEGFIPYEILPGFAHPYRVDLCFGAATGPTVTINGPALRFALSSAVSSDGVDASGLI